jgi:hypothetical protein
MPRDPDTPGCRSRQNWDFKVFSNDNDNKLVVPRGYEYARESVLLTNIMKEWLRLEKPRAELFQRAAEKHIEREDVHRALLNYWKAVRVELYTRQYGKPVWRQDVRERVKRDHPAAVTLLAELTDSFHEIVCCERSVEKIETCAPGLRCLAKYFAADTPYLLIPQSDRDDAVASAGKHESIFFRAVPAVESVVELQEKIRKGEALPEIHPDYQDVGLRIRPNRGVTAIDEEFAQWRKQHFPQSMTTTDGHSHRSSSRWVDLKGLAAMRLSHVIPFKDAFRGFREVYGANIDEDRYWKLRRGCFSTFRQLFGTEEEPRHWKSLAHI